MWLQLLQLLFDWWISDYYYFSLPHWDAATPLVVEVKVDV